MIRPHRKKNMISYFSGGVARKEERQSEAVVPEKIKARKAKAKPKPWALMYRYVGADDGFWWRLGYREWCVRSRYETEKDAKTALESRRKKGDQWRPGRWEYKIVEKP